MADSTSLRLVLFRVGSVLWAAPASTVREVISSGPATRIPGSHPAVAGLVNLRGTLLTVVDGRRALGVADTGTAQESILVVAQRGRFYGLSVDAVLDLVDFAPEMLEQGTLPVGADPRLSRGSGQHAGRAFAVLDTELLLQPVLG
jgi:chemotaxis signal transduction protein